MSARVITRPWRTQPPGGYRLNRDSHLARLARFAHVFTPQSTVDLTGSGAALTPEPSFVGYRGGPYGLGWQSGAQAWATSLTVTGGATFNSGPEGFWVVQVLNNFTGVDGSGGILVGYNVGGDDGLGVASGNLTWYWYSGIRLSGPAVPVGVPSVVGGWYGDPDMRLFVNGQFASGSHGGAFAPTNVPLRNIAGQPGMSMLNGNVAAVFAGWGKPPDEFFLRMWENPWQVFEPRRIWVPVAAAGGGTTVNLAGTAAGQATPAGTLSITAQLVGASLGVATPTGTISVALNPAGAVLGAAVVAGALALEVPLAASAQAVAQTAGALGVVKPLAGVSAGLAAITGTLSVSSGAALDGAAAGAAQVVGALDLLKPLSGNSLGAAAVAGGLSLAIAFNGAALGQAFVQGALQIEGAVDLAGAAQGAVTVQGALDKLAALSAAAGGEADVRATLALTLNLSGTAGGQAAGAGTLLVQGGISGAALAEAIAAGSLTLAVNMSGAALGQALVGAFFGAPQWAGTTLVPGLSIYHLSPHVDVAGDDLDVRIDYLEPRVAAQLAYV